jgi:hypothetical protein
MVTEQGSFVIFPSRFDQNLTQLKLTEPETTRNLAGSDMTTLWPPPVLFLGA